MMQGMILIGLGLLNIVLWTIDKILGLVALAALGVVIVWLLHIGHVIG